jgi:hypothetical protein
MRYEDVPGFESLYLEDTFVLDVRVTPSSVVFEVEVVLLQAHRLYSEPSAGERYCYSRLSIKTQRSTMAALTNLGR